jgi:serine/threonine protein kinase
VRLLCVLCVQRWITYQLLHALSQAHAHGVCHGDIKCENVMVTSWNWLLLTDFASYKPTYLPADNPVSWSGDRVPFPEHTHVAVVSPPARRRGRFALAARSAEMCTCGPAVVLWVLRWWCQHVVTLVDALVVPHLDLQADFSYYFDTGGRRRCYLAPERFFEGSPSAINTAAPLQPDMVRNQHAACGPAALCCTPHAQLQLPGTVAPHTSFLPIA